MTRRFVSIALALVIAAIALVVWWASAHTVASDVAGERGADVLSDVTEQARAELETSESERIGARTAVTATTAQLPRAVASKPLADEVPRPIGEIHLRIVDEQQRPLRGLSGTLHLGRDPLAHVTVGREGKALAWSQAPDGPLVEEERDIAIPKNGEFVFEHLSFGKWSVVCQAAGCKRTSVDVILFDGGPRQDVAIVLTRQRTLEVSLRTQGGESFIAALKRAYPRYGELVRPELSEDPGNGVNGFVTFTTATVPSNDATYWRTLRADSLATLTVSAFVADTLIARAEAPVGIDDVKLVASVATLEAALGSLAVLVIDAETERPIDGATVTCRCAGFEPPEQRTGPDGRAHFAGLIGPKASVTVQCEGHSKAAQDAVITAKTRTESIVRVERGVTISGELRTEDGRPANDFAKLASFAEGATTGTFVVQPNRKNGPTFVIRDLPRGEYVVFTSKASSTGGVRMGTGLELREPPAVAVRNGRLPDGLVYVDARRGSVSDVVVVVPKAVSDY